MTRYQYRRLDADTFIRRDSATGACVRVPASEVPRLRLSQDDVDTLPPAQPEPSTSAPDETAKDAEHRQAIYAAMLDFQTRAHQAGDPESAAPYLEALAGLADDPDELDRVRMSWIATAYTDGKPHKYPFKAVGEGEHQGRILYGEAAQRAIRAQQGRGGLSPADHAAGIKRSSKRASEILGQIHSGTGITKEHLNELATHLPALPVPQLQRARTLLEASWGGKRPNKAGMRDALMDHVRKLVDGPNALLPGLAGHHARQQDEATAGAATVPHPAPAPETPKETAPPATSNRPVHPRPPAPKPTDWGLPSGKVKKPTESKSPTGTGPPSGSSAGSFHPPQGVQLRDFHDDGVEPGTATIKSVFGESNDPALIGAAANASDGGRVSVYVRGEESITLTTVGHGYTAYRTFERKKNGELHVFNDEFKIEKGASGKPTNPHLRSGTEIFANQVAALRQMGATKITTCASGDAKPGSDNGYYSWPRMGYDGRVPADVWEHMPAPLKAQAGGDLARSSVLSLMGTLEGRNWWKANGRQFAAHFDLRDGSRNMLALSAYLHERRTNPNGGTSGTEDAGRSPALRAGTHPPGAGGTEPGPRTGAGGPGGGTQEKVGLTGSGAPGGQSGRPAVAPTRPVHPRPPTPKRTDWGLPPGRIKKPVGSDIDARNADANEGQWDYELGDRYPENGPIPEEARTAYHAARKAGHEPETALLAALRAKPATQAATEPEHESEPAPAGHLFDAGEKPRAAEVKTAQDIADMARRRMPGLHIDPVPAGAPLADHLDALAAIDRHARGLGVPTTFFGDLADHVQKTTDDLAAGTITPKQARAAADDVTDSVSESPDAVAHELRVNGHTEAALFFERQAHKALSLAKSAIEQHTGPTPEEKPEPQTVEEVEERVRTAFAQKADGARGTADAFADALEGVPTQLRDAFYRKHGLKPEDPNRGFYKTRSANAAKALAKFSAAPQEDEPETKPQKAPESAAEPEYPELRRNENYHRARMPDADDPALSRVPEGDITALLNAVQNNPWVKGEGLSHFGAVRTALKWPQNRLAYALVAAAKRGLVSLSSDEGSAGRVDKSNELAVDADSHDQYAFAELKPAGQKALADVGRTGTESSITGPDATPKKAQKPVKVPELPQEGTLDTHESIDGVIHKTRGAAEAVARGALDGAVVRVGRNWLAVHPFKPSVPHPSAGAAPKTGSVVGLDDAAFAHKVQAVANAQPSPYGNSKAFIHHVFDALKAEDPSLTEDEFKRRLVAANQDRRLDLLPADLNQAFDPHDVSRSATRQLSSTYHLINKREPAPAAPATRRGGSVTGLTDDEFAQKVQTVADEHPHGFGDNKTFISDIFDALKAEDPSLPRAEFDRRLLHANATRKLSLSRADLVQLMHPEDVARSKVNHPSGMAEFNFVMTSNQKPGANPQKITRGPNDPRPPRTGLLGPDANAGEIGYATHRIRASDPRYLATFNAAQRTDGFPESYHRRAVERELKAGTPVPPEVLADYPDLAAKYGQGQPAPGTIDNVGQIDRLSDTAPPAPEPEIEHGDVERTREGTPGGGLPAGEPVGGDAPAAPGPVLPGSGQRDRKGTRRLPPGADGQRDAADAADADGRDARRRGGRGGAVGLPADAPGRGGPPGGVGDGKRGGGLDGREPAIPDPTPAETVVAEPPTPENPTDLAAGNFHYHNAPELGGAKQKFSGNLAAIRTLQAIKAEGRDRATPEEQAILSRYVGWGQFKALMNDYGTHDGENAHAWTEERRVLKGLLTNDEWEAARASIKNAHYTSPHIVDAHWKMAQRLGFNSGRFLETSAGIGYYLGMMPPELAGRTRSTAVELDPTTAGMLKMLYPSANVQNQGFEEHQSPDGFYDLVASNVPFGDYGVHDPRYNKHQANIHDYFLLKSADKVRPGGLMMHITSAGTMDKLDPAIRDELAKSCDLVSAIRFPGGAHKKNAGTEVVTDMLILRKRHPGEEPSGPDWSGTTTVPDPGGGEPIVVNKYFADHPEQILGTLDRSGKLYAGDTKGVSQTDDYHERLEAAINRLPEGLMKPLTAPPKRFAPNVLPAPKAVKNGGFHLNDKGQVFVRRGGESVEQPGLDKATTERIAGHLNVRDALRTVFNEQAAGRDGAEARAALNKAYDQFVKKHGPINLPVNRRAFMTDPDASPLAALEKYNPKTKTAQKADIFFKHVGRSFAKATSAADVGEGLGISLHENGRLDLGRVAQLVNRPVAEVGKELTERGLAYENPGKGWEPAGHYLAGNVRQKLVEARAAAAADPKYAPNVAALEAVQPQDLDHTEIKVKLGAPWVPASDVARFAGELLGGRAEHFDVNHLPQLGWSASYSDHGRNRFRNSDAVNAQWGVTSQGRVAKRFDDLLEAALNNSSVKITYRDGDKEYLDREATDKAMSKVQEIRDKFADWVWEDDARRHRLHRFYNDNFNNVKPIQYDGSHQKFPGMNPAVTLRPHQSNAVWQVVTTGGGLLAHEVGTGKTKVMGAAAMELRRLGLAKKPCVVCKKANVEAVTREIQDLYPGAKILSTVDNFDKKNRKAVVSQMATGDHDIVVMTHDQLDMLPMHPDVERAQIKAEMKELAAVKASAEGAVASGQAKKKGNQLSDVEKAIAKLEKRLKEIADPDKKDDAVYFEDTGIDHLLVDEAHKYKSLPCYSRMERVKGVPSARSEIATNMLHRCRWLQQNNGGRGVTFLTGTPVPNALPELFTMQRFLQPDELKARGIDTFDAWASTFGNIETKMEFTATGDYKPVSRFRSYANVGDLSQIASGMLDVVKADPKHIVRPKREDHAVAAPKTKAVTEMMAWLADRARKLKGRPEKGTDNMAAIFTDGRKGSTDMRLLNAAASDDPDSKTNQCVRNVLRLSREHPGTTQLIFSDMGVNESKSGFNLYDDVIQKLVDGGIPREKIANFGELEGKKKEEAIEAMKRGEVLVGIGGTERLGTGVNVQNKVKALHHLDAPFRPADIEQRDGRGWRQGNMNDPSKPAHEQTVGIYRYVTEGSLDQLMWDIIARKKAGIDQVIRPGGTTARELKEHDEENLSPEQISAIASGNPHIQEKVQVDEDVRQLQNAHARHQKEQAKLRDTVAATERNVPHLERDASEKQADAATTAGYKEFGLTVDGRHYTDRKEAQDALEAKVLRTSDPWKYGVHIGEFKGLGLYKVGEKVVLRSKSGQQYHTGGSVASLEYVANKRIALDAEEARQKVANARQDADRAKAAIGKTFPKGEELQSKIARQKRLEKILAGTALPDGYEEGQVVDLADGRRAKLIEGRKDGRISALIDNKEVDLHPDDISPPKPAPSPTPSSAVGSPGMETPDYTKWDALLRTATNRAQAEQIAKATGIPIRPEAAPVGPVDTTTLAARFRTARADPTQFDALAADLARPSVSRDDLNALAKTVSPELYERVKKLPKPKQIEALRGALPPQ